MKILKILFYNGENFDEESIIIIPTAENKDVNGTCSFEKKITSSFTQKIFHT